LERCFSRNPVGVVEAHGGTMVYLSLYFSHLSCLFPQHGEGKKHERSIRLEPWQVRLVEETPWRLLRGFIRSDGCVFVNRTGPYSYLSYHFSNKSTDIIELFTGACRQVGVEYRLNCWRGLWNIRVNRRRSVRLMMQEVGMKE
jgi:LAGLIDADG-like domain